MSQKREPEHEPSKTDQTKAEPAPAPLAAPKPAAGLDNGAVSAEAFWKSAAKFQRLR